MSFGVCRRPRALAILVLSAGCRATAEADDRSWNAAASFDSLAELGLQAHNHTRVTLPIGAVVFDLAGVLLDFQGAESIARLSNGRVSATDFNRFWTTPLSTALYTGACSPDAFAEGAVEALGLPIDPSAFLREFRTWLRGPYEGAFELVAAVRNRAMVACLSNTNSLDVARFRSELALHHRFDHCFFSNEIGLRKPDPACYSHVLDALGFPTAPERVVFFDDSADCVEGARAAGMRAYQAASVPALVNHLTTLGILSPNAGLVAPEER